MKSIQNTSKKTTIAKAALVCASCLCKTVGLMFSLNPKCIVFTFKKERRQQLHMLFVFFSIDLLFLDSDKKVVELKEKFRPFTFYNSRKRAQYVIECPIGTIRRTKTAIGDKVKF